MRVRNDVLPYYKPVVLIVINYNYGTQFWTPLGEKIQELKRAIYTSVIKP